MNSRFSRAFKLGFFQKGRTGEMDFRPKKEANLIIYLYLLIFCISAGFLIIFIRLFQLTVVKGSYFRQLADGNRIREVIIEPKRGRILDRKGFVLAENTEPNIHQPIERINSKRTYFFPEIISHLIGYRKVADKNDLKNDNCLDKLLLGDKVGKKGVEKLFDCDLRGEHGKKLVEVDAQGQYLNTLSILAPVEGKQIQLAVDLDLQKKAYDLIKNKKAAVVALKPKTGEILVMVSSPSFNPQDFEDGSATVEKYFQDGKKPLFNRAAEASYPAGSIFKTVIATGALEEKKITVNTQFEDTGTIKAGPLTFGNWYFLQYGKTEGMVNVVKAIQRSNDIFFYLTGAKLGEDKIKIWAERFGYGKATEFGLDESEGLVPSAFWKKEVLHENWYLGDTYNLSIGQGYLLVTPLQVAVATSVFANNGYLCQPKLLKGEKPNCQKLPISQNTLDLVREGMKEACSPGGTGWPLFEFKIPVACKTGTAELYTTSKTPHAWFTAYAPFNSPAGEPEIIVTVLEEEGGQGSDVAGPIVRDILKAYFERQE